MSATIHDVARAAGVSTATVGRVLHNKGYVSEEARKKIEQAVQELGYVPSQSARSLKGGKSGLIGCLVRQNINGLYYKIVKSVSEEAEKHGYETITMEADHPGKEADLVRNFIGLRVDGLVIISDEFVDAKSLQALKQAGIPVAAAERDYLDFGIDSLQTGKLSGRRS